MKFIIIIRKIVDGKQAESFMGLTCEWDEIIPKVRYHVNDDYERGFNHNKPDWDNISLTITQANDELWNNGLKQLLGTPQNKNQRPVE